MRMTRLFAAALLPLIAACAQVGAADPAAATRTTVEVRFNTPNPGYGVRITEAYAAGDRLALLAEVTPPAPGRMYPAVIAEVSDQAVVPGSYGDITRYVIGRTWGWDDERVEFLPSRQAFEEKVQGMTRVAVAKP